MKRKISLSLFFVLFVILTFSAKPTILVIESYHDEYAWDKSYIEGIKEVLGKNYNLQYFEMDTKRIPKEKHQEMADKAWKKYEELKPVLVIIGDDAALKFLGQRFARTQTPCVFMGINNNPRNYFKELPKNMTGILERPLIKRSIMLVKEIYPKSKKVLVLFDTDITSQLVKSEIFANEDKMNILNLDVELKLIDTYQNWKNEIISAKDQYDLIFTGLYQTLKDEKGNVVDSEEVIKWTSKNTLLPIFGFWDFACGEDKAIGGYVLYGKDNGIMAGEVALQILKGKAPSTISYITNDSGKFLFSNTQLNKWKIVLPANIKKEASYIK